MSFYLETDNRLAITPCPGSDIDCSRMSFLFWDLSLKELGKNLSFIYVWVVLLVSDRWLSLLSVFFDFAYVEISRIVILRYSRKIVSLSNIRCNRYGMVTSNDAWFLEQDDIWLKARTFHFLASRDINATLTHDVASFHFSRAPFSTFGKLHSGHLISDRNRCVLPRSLIFLLRD